MDTPAYSYDNSIKQIDRIDFDILSNHEIKERSALGKDTAGIEVAELHVDGEPKKGGLIDLRLGTTDNDNDCLTCQFNATYDPGHFGHMDLAEPVFNIGFLDHIKKILDCICLKCSKLLVYKNEKELEELLKTKTGKARLAEVKNYTKNVSYCQKPGSGCGTLVSKIKVEIKKTTGIVNIIAETDIDTIKDESVQMEGKKKLRQILTPQIVYEKLRDISDNDCRILGMDPTRSRPEDMVHLTFPIPPVQMRPSTKGDFMGGSTMEDDLTHKLSDIIKANHRINKQKESMNENMSKYARDQAYLLQYQIGSYIDNQMINPPKSDQKGKPFKALAPRIKSKEGRIRGNLMGKRVDFSGRTVITSDPTIDNNQLGVPVKMAMTLTFPEVVTPQNIEYLTGLVRNGREKYPGANFVFPLSSIAPGQRVLPIDLRFRKEQVELRYGDVVERHLKNGDIVLLNRQPTLHKQSMMGHRIKVIDNPDLMTYRLSVAITTPYNADFDGDEMNIFVPQSIQTQIELEEIADVKRQIITPSTSRTIIGIVQDGLLGAYNLTAPTMRIDWRNAMNIMSYTSIEDFTTFKKDKEYTGHELFSLIIPPAINLNRGNVKIKGGNLIEGRLSKDMLGSKKKNAIHQLIWDEYGAEETKKFIDDTQRLINNFNLYNGFTVGYGDVEIPASVNTEINKLFETKEQKVNHMITEIENNPDLMEKRVFEFKIFSELNIIRDDVSKLVMANLKPDNNFNIMILSGSKGDATNMGQISGCVGLQAHEGKLIPMKDNDRTLAYYHQNDDRAESRGLVKQSFVTGIEFPSFAYHLLAGREGLIDSSIKSVTGDTPIVILENGVTNCVNIGDWIDEKLKIDSKLVKHYAEREMELLDLTKDVKIPTTDEDGNVNWCTISAITRHDPGKELYEIETLGGRKVIVTESKSLLIWNNSTKKFVHTSTPEVKIGDYVPVTMNLASPPKIQKYIEVSNYLPKEKYVYGTEYNSACRRVTRAMKAHPQHDSKYANLLPAGWWKLNNNINFTLPHNSAYKLVRSMKRSNIDNVKDGNVYPYSARRKDTKVPDKLELTRDNGLFMGLFLAEGNTDGKYIQITNLNKNIQTFVKQWFTKMSITYSEETKINKIGGTSTCVRGFSTVLSSLLTELMGHGARNKFVPVEAYNAPEEFIIGFLDGYFSGDGTVTKTEIRATSASKKLIEGINMLCSRLNIFGKTSVTRIKSNNLGTINMADINVISIRSKWAKVFAQKISLIDECKNKKLLVMTPTSRNIHFESVNDVVLDKIIAINKVDVTKYPKVYDLTVPDTLNFGLANGLHVVDTATTGYAQRRLVKSMEDLMVKYDGTVRTANDTLIQIVYGDSGSNTTRQFEYTIKFMEMGDNELASVHKFTPEELKSFKGYKMNDEVFETIKLMRETLRHNMTKARADFIKITNTFMLPVNISRIVDNNLGNSKMNEGEKVEPSYVYKKINEIMANDQTGLMCMTTDERDNKDSLKNKDEQISKTVFKMALYDAISPKRCVVEFGMPKKQFDSIIDEIVANFNRNIVQPGEMVGIIGAQSMGEPLTQMSVLRTSSVLIKNTKKNTIYRGEIGDFVDDLLKTNDKYVKNVPNAKDSVVLDINDYEIIGVSDIERTSWKKIQQISRHPVNGKLIKIKTKSGRTVTTTLSHSHLARKDHKIVPIKGSDLKVGHRIPVTFSNKIAKDGLKTIQIGNMSHKLTHEFGWLCGVYLADGCIRGNTINISKIIPECQENIKNICAEILDSDVKVRKEMGEHGESHMSVFTHKDLAKFLSEEFGNGSYNKKIPGFAFNTNYEFMSGLIGGYFDGDGNFNVKRSDIRVGSRSKELIEGIAILLTFFGIFGSFVEETSKNYPEKIFYTYQVQRKYAETFKTDIYMCVKHKLDSLDEIIKLNEVDKHANTNFIDMIPGLGETIAYIGKTLKLPRQSRNYGRWIKKPAVGRNTLAKFIKIFNREVEKVEDEVMKKDVVNQIKLLEQACYSDVIWDEITEIKLLDDPKEYVYDFTVPGNDSFMINSGVLVHNTLNAFHSSGIASMSTTTQGVPRVQELLSVSKKPKTPRLVIYMTPEFKQSKEMAHKIASHIKHTTLGDIRGRIQIYYEPKPNEKGNLMDADGVKHVFFNQKSTKNSCQGDINGLPWVMRIEMDREKMLEKEVTLLEIKSKFCNWWEKRFNEARTMKKEEKKVINKISSIAVLSNSDSDKQPVIHIRFNVKDVDKVKDPFNRETLNDFVDYIIDKFKLKGIDDIVDIPAITEERMVMFDKETNDVKYVQQQVIFTSGVNLTEIRYIIGIDALNVICNDIVEVYNTFGIEIARTRLMRELSMAYENAGHAVNYQNLSLLVDIMTHSGIIMSIDRHGMNKSDTDPLSRASFEKAVEQLRTAAVFGETDHMRGVSSRVMGGLVIKGGTGFCDVLLDTNMIEKSEYTEDTNVYKPYTEITSGNIATDIINKDNSEIFIPA